MDRNERAEEFGHLTAVRARICLALLAVHFLLITAVCCRDTFWLVAQGFTLLPPSASAMAKKGEVFASTTLGERLQRRQFLRQSIGFYLNLGGIETGYGFFAPNVGGSSRLVFELHFADGRVTYEPAGWGRNESALRVSTFVDYVSQTKSERLRGILINSLARSIWQRHPDLVKLRAILGVLSYPLPAELLQGKGAAYDFVGSYDLIRPDNLSRGESP